VYEYISLEDFKQYDIDKTKRSCCGVECLMGVACGQRECVSLVKLRCDSKLQPTRCNFSWFIYFYRRSTCFRRFLRPSSGAHNCTYSFRYCQYCC